MRRIHLQAIAAAAALAASAPAYAWLIYTDRDDPSQWVVEIEQPFGDIVSLRSLPPPFNQVVQPAASSEPLLYRWRYGREAEGMAYLDVDTNGRGRMAFEFIVREPINGQRLGAAAVFVAKDRTPLHTFYARADAVGDAFAGGARHHHVSLALERTPEWWKKVDAIAFFNMRYYRQQALSDEEVWDAMRRAVANFSKGQGTEQRG